jgi:hypothetical protein
VEEEGGGERIKIINSWKTKECQLLPLNEELHVTSCILHACMIIICQACISGLQLRGGRERERVEGREGGWRDYYHKLTIKFSPQQIIVTQVK